LRALESVLRSEPDVVGIDVAGEERTCFTPTGMTYFKSISRMMRKVAIAKRRRLVVHVHVGEGTAMTELEGKRARYLSKAGASIEKACRLFERYPTARLLGERDAEAAATLPGQGDELIHVAAARQNVGVLLGAIEELRSELPDIGEHLVFRFGHATHVSEEQARRMKASGVTADVNLTSNLSTGSFWLSPATHPEAFAGVGPATARWNDLRALLGEKVASLLDQHGVHALWKAGVTTILGTDGGGVEHAGIKREYELAAALLRRWAKELPAGMGVGALYRFAREHVKRVWGSK
jgi:hypothetical protein